MARTIGSALKSLVLNRNETFRRFFIVNVLPVDAVEEHHKQVVATPFPWRQRPNYSHYNEIQFQRMESELKKYQSMDEFVRGAVAAFHCAVNSIFSHPKLASHRIGPSENIKNQMVVGDKEICSESLPFYNIFETFLTQFLEQSIYQFLQKNGNYKFCYELMKIRSTKIHAAEYLMYSSQLAKRYPYLIFDQTLGERIAERKLIVPPTRSEDDENCFENSEVLRVWVDFDCDELFYVKDPKTDTIVQGSTKPTTVKHQILLEACVPWVIKDPNQIFHSEWKIVDIDNWLDGNKEVWLKKRLH